MRKKNHEQISKNILYRLETRKSIIYASIIYLVLSAVLLAGLVRVVLPNSKGEKLLLTNFSTDNSISIESLGNSIHQDITGIEGEIYRIQIPIKCKNANPDSKILISIKINDEIIQEEEIVFENSDQEAVTIIFTTPVTVERDDVISICINHNEEYIDGTASFILSQWNIDQIKLYEDDSKMEYEIATYISGIASSNMVYLYLLVYLILSIVYAIICYGIMKKKWKIETLFVIICTVFGVLYTVFWSPYACPDEHFHVGTAYYYASELLGEPTVDEEGNILVRECDLYFTPNEITTRQYSYNLIFSSSFFNEDTNKEFVSLRCSLLGGVPPFAYIPQIIGICIARILRFSNVSLLLLGRLLALISYMVFGYYSIKLIPFGKRALMILMLGPTAIQAAASFSYDSMLNSCAFLFIAYTLYLAYEKKQTKIGDWVVLALTSICFTPIKVVYILLVFLIILIPNNKISQNSMKAYGVKIALLLMNVLTLIWGRQETVQSMANSYVNEDGVAGYTLSTIVSNPLKTIVLWANTIRERSVFYLEQVFGGYKSYSKIEISLLVIVGFYILLTLALVIKENETIPSFKEKALFSVISLGIFCLILLGFNLAKDCTNILSPCIYGVQGRYFLPFLPLVFICLQTRSIVVKKDITGQLAIGVFCLQFLTVCTIFETVIAR